MRQNWRGSDVVAALDRAAAELGYPKTIRLDNGPEFISKDLDLWGTTSDRRCPVLSSNSIARQVLLRMGRQHVRGGTISVRQQKTGAQLDIPLHSDLVAAIAATPTDQMAFLVGRRGKAYSPQSFGHWFNKACKVAGLEVGCPPKGYESDLSAVGAICS